MSVKFKESIQWYEFFYVEIIGLSGGCLQSESDHKWRSVSTNMNNT